MKRWSFSLPGAERGADAANTAQGPRRRVPCVLAHQMAAPLKSDRCRPGVQALAFDVFGTVVDWRVELLQAPPEEVMIVAAHVYDLRAARAQGLRTAFVRRPQKWGPAAAAEESDPGEFDVVADDFEDLATQPDC